MCRTGPHSARPYGRRKEQRPAATAARCKRKREALKCLPPEPLEGRACVSGPLSALLAIEPRHSARMDTIALSVQCVQLNVLTGIIQRLHHAAFPAALITRRPALRLERKCLE